MARDVYKPMSVSSPVTVLWTYLLLLCCLIPTLFLQTVAPSRAANEAPEKDLASIFQKAKNDMLEGRWETAVPQFQTLLQELESRRLRRKLTDEEKTIYARCLDYLGRDALISQRLDEAQFYYLTLLQFDPFYEFPDTPTPTIDTFFRELRRTRIGLLSLQVEPPDARIFLDQQEIGKGGLSSYPVVEGTYQLRVERSGYTSWSHVITIKGGATLNPAPVHLQRTSAAVFVATRPTGVEIYLDGHHVGTTSGPPSVPIITYAKEHNIPEQEFSDYLSIEIPDSLEHYLEFKKSCYEPFSIIVPKTSSEQDLFLDPVNLTPAVGRIQLVVNAEADVYVDGEWQGKSSQKSLSICVGTRDLTLKNSWSTWSQSITVKRGTDQELEIRMWPKTAFLGWQIQEGASEFASRRAQDILQEALKGLEHAVWLDFSDTALSIQGENRKGQAWGQFLLNLWEAGRYDDLKKTLGHLAQVTESRLFLVASVPREDIPRHVEFLLFSDLSGLPDRYVADLTQPDAVTHVIQRLNHEEPVIQRMLPFTLGRTNLYPYPIIFKIYPQAIPKPNKENTPNLAVGQLVYSIAGLKMDQPDSLVKIRDLIQDKEIVTVQFGNPFTGQIRSTEIPLITSPVELDAGMGNRWYNRLAIGYLRWAEMPGQELATQVARLNLGLVFMSFQEWAKAYEWFSQVKIERDKGISQPTVEYHMAETYLALGYLADARKLVDKLKNAGEATLGNDMGRHVAEAVQELEVLIRPGGK